MKRIIAIITKDGKYIDNEKEIKEYQQNQLQERRLSNNIALFPFHHKLGLSFGNMEEKHPEIMPFDSDEWKNIKKTEKETLNKLNKNELHGE